METWNPVILEPCDLGTELTLQRWNPGTLEPAVGLQSWVHVMRTNNKGQTAFTGRMVPSNITLSLAARSTWRL